MTASFVVTDITMYYALQISTYRVTVEATDKGTPDRQTSQVLIIINIGDINDNPPKFSQTNYTGQVQVLRSKLS